jgi:hypothetical protein
MKNQTIDADKPAARKSPLPAAAPGQERANENFRGKAVARTAVTPPDANAHIREGAEPKDKAAPAEKNQRNPAAPKRGFERGDSRSQPGNYQPYNADSAPHPTDNAPLREQRDI